MLDDLGNPPPAAVARALGVTVRTVQRWQLAGNAPRAPMLALFWITRWGRSEVDCRAVNDAVLKAHIARAAQAEAEAYAAQVSHLLELGNFGAANVPLWRGPRSIRPPAALDDRPAHPAPPAAAAPQDRSGALKTGSGS